MFAKGVRWCCTPMICGIKVRFQRQSVKISRWFFFGNGTVRSGLNAYVDEFGFLIMMLFITLDSLLVRSRRWFKDNGCGVFDVCGMGKVAR